MRALHDHARGAGATSAKRQRTYSPRTRARASLQQTTESDGGDDNEKQKREDERKKVSPQKQIEFARVTIVNHNRKSGLRFAVIR